MSCLLGVLRFAKLFLIRRFHWNNKERIHDCGTQKCRLFTQVWRCRAGFDKRPQLDNDRRRACVRDPRPRERTAGPARAERWHHKAAPGWPPTLRASGQKGSPCRQRERAHPPPSSWPNPHAPPHPTPSSPLTLSLPRAGQHRAKLNHDSTFDLGQTPIPPQQKHPPPLTPRFKLKCKC